jgi:hypothetical protein
MIAVSFAVVSVESDSEVAESADNMADMPVDSLDNSVDSSADNLDSSDNS